MPNSKFGMPTPPLAEGMPTIDVPVYLLASAAWAAASRAIGTRHGLQDT